jgi:hypothetical protein
MKISVRYGLYTAAAIVAWFLIGYFFSQYKQLSENAGLLSLFFFAIGVFFSVKHTRDRECKGAADPRFLLKAGLTTSSIVSLAYCIFIFFTYELIGKGTASAGDKIMSLLMLFIMNVLVGGLFSVMLAFYFARKK